RGREPGGGRHAAVDAERASRESAEAAAGELGGERLRRRLVVIRPVARRRGRDGGTHEVASRRERRIRVRQRYPIVVAPAGARPAPRGARAPWRSTGAASGSPST